MIWQSDLRRLAVIDVRDDAEVADVVEIHCGGDST